MIHVVRKIMKGASMAAAPQISVIASGFDAPDHRHLVRVRHVVARQGWFNTRPLAHL